MVCVASTLVSDSTLVPGVPSDLEGRLEAHRRELTGYCYRMLASPFEAEDAVQETMLRAWRAQDRLENAGSLRSWLYSIATNVCLDALAGRKRRARPMDLDGAGAPIVENLRLLDGDTWVQPVPMTLIADPSEDPAEMAQRRESVRLAFVAALQSLPPRQRAAVILCEVLRWKAAEAAELLDTSVASINSALQRARATLAGGEEAEVIDDGLSPADRELLDRYVEAFEAYDVEALTELIHADATQSMPPYDLWLEGREDIFAWWLGPGEGCRGSRLLPAIQANGSPAYGQYKPSPDGGYDPWALIVLELRDGRIGEFTFFLEPQRLFELWGLPPRLDE